MKMIEYTKIKMCTENEVICMNPAQQVLECPKEFNTTDKQVREMVLESYRDVGMGKGRECNDFFKELEKRYLRV